MGGGQHCILQLVRPPRLPAYLLPAADPASALPLPLTFPLPPLLPLCPCLPASRSFLVDRHDLPEAAAAGFFTWGVLAFKDLDAGTCAHELKAF